MKNIKEERARLYAKLEISDEKIKRVKSQFSNDCVEETIDCLTTLFLERMQLRKELEDLWRKEGRADKGSSDK